MCIFEKKEEKKMASTNSFKSDSTNLFSVLYKIEFHSLSKVGLNAGRFLSLEPDGMSPSNKFFP